MPCNLVFDLGLHCSRPWPDTACLSASVKTTATTRRNQGACCFLVIVCVASMLSTAMAFDGDGASAARRRRERRLRSWRRHPQPPTTTSTRWRLKQSTPAYGHSRRTGQRLRAELHGDRGPDLFQLYEEEPGGVQPPPLSEVRPQETLQRDAGIGFELVQALIARLARARDRPGIS